MSDDEKVPKKVLNKLEADIEVKKIFSDDEFNCRGDTITPGSVFELASSIASNPAGLMQRIIIQPYKHDIKHEIEYRVVAGHRRLAAIRSLKWKTIPAVVIIGLSDEDAEIMNIEENLKRKDLNILQEAKAFDKMLARGIPPAQIAKKLDLGKRYVDERLLLLQLPNDVQLEAAAGIIKASHIQELVKMSKLSLEKMYEGVRNIKNANGRRKIIVRVQNTQAPTKVREFRKMSDIFKVQDTILDGIGTNLASQALAWAIGEIGTIELLNSVKYEANLMGLPWSIPQDYIEEDRLEKKALAMRMKNEEVDCSPSNYVNDGHGNGDSDE
jgi:ParB/RepB/Spo0J family partition protein